MSSVHSDISPPSGASGSNFSADDVFAAPVSFAQQRMWFLHQLEPESAAYNIQAAVRIQGNLNVRALEQSLNEVVRRHESLRSSFVMINERVLQVINPELKLELGEIDLRTLPPGQREKEVQRLARQIAGTPFDVELAPLLRADLLRLDHEEYVLVLLMDHIISDGWSMGVLIQELCVLYQVYSLRQPSPLPELEIQYVDYAQWQREYLTGDVLKEQLEYWKRQLSDASPVLDLPADRSRPPLQSDRGATEVLELSPGLTEKLKALSQQQGATLFMTLLAAFQVFLYRLTGQSDLSVGAPVAGRTQPETENLVGCFVNTLVLRSVLSGHASFIEVLNRAREVTLEAQSHQDVPFELLVEELQPERNLGHSPFFQVMLVLHPPLPEIKLPGLRIKQIELENDTAKFELMFSFRESEQGLSWFLEYRTDRFDSATVKRLGVRFKLLLAGIVAEPGQRISELRMLTEAEAVEQVEEWNATAREYPRTQSVAELFEQEAARGPEAVAVVCGAEEVSYDELNRRANQVAHYLRELGVRAEVSVGLCLERSVEMVVGLLGILKAGGAYVPLDPDYPLERLHFMLEDAGVSVLLTQERLLSSLPTHHSQVVCLDRDREEIAQRSERNPEVEVAGDNLAYVMYTSGSTGQAKGVSVTHRNIVRLVQGTEYVEFGSEEVFLQMAPITFDASTFELWGSLLHGAKLVMMAAGRATLAELGAALQEHKVS